MPKQGARGRAVSDHDQRPGEPSACQPRLHPRRAAADLVLGALRPMPNWAAASRMRTIHLERGPGSLASYACSCSGSIPAPTLYRGHRAPGQREPRRWRSAWSPPPPTRPCPPAWPRPSGPPRADRRHRARGRGPRTGALLDQRPHRGCRLARPAGFAMAEAATAGARSWSTRRTRYGTWSVHGGADKRQVGEMVQRLLGLASVLTPADAAVTRRRYGSATSPMPAPPGWSRPGR